MLDDCRARAQESLQDGKPVSRAAGAVIVAIWLAAIVLCAVWGYRALKSRQTFAFRGKPVRSLLRLSKKLYLTRAVLAPILGSAQMFLVEDDSVGNGVARRNA